MTLEFKCDTKNNLSVTLKFLFDPNSTPYFSLVTQVLVAQKIRVSSLRSGGTNYDPVPQHTKVVKISTICFLLGIQILVVELGLVAQVSVY